MNLWGQPNDLMTIVFSYAISVICPNSVIGSRKIIPKIYLFQEFCIFIALAPFPRINLVFER